MEPLKAIEFVAEQIDDHIGSADPARPMEMVWQWNRAANMLHGIRLTHAGQAEALAQHLYELASIQLLWWSRMAEAPNGL